MKRSLLILIISALSFSAIQAQDNNRKFLVGLVKNRITQVLMADVTVKLYRNNELVDEHFTNPREHMSGGDEGHYYVLAVPADSGTYTIRFEKEGFETVEKTLFSNRFKSLEKTRFQPTVYMMPKPKENTLGSVNIKATQIKFYHKGDTIIYNADIFNLPQGSMLDNLIKSMPGAELSDDGEITINGRKVDALLLNGEKFFKNNNKVMLENLPSYMVKNLKAYEKEDKASKIPGMTRKAEEYVLDVILKKEYSIGWIGNVEAGMGSEDRYLARLFGLRFTTASRIGVYANFNNLNDKRKPGEDSNWTPDKMPTGLTSQKAGGIDYLIKPKFTNYKFAGSADIAYTDADVYRETTTETYMPQGSLFTRNRTNSRGKQFAFNTTHQWEMLKEDGETGLYLYPSLKYSRQDSRSAILSGTFNGNPYDYAEGTALFDSIYQLQGNNLRRMMLNRYDRKYKQNGYSLSSGLMTTYALTISGMYVALNAHINNETKKRDVFDRYDLSYPNDPSEASQYLYRYSHQKPDRILNYSFFPKIIMALPKGRLELSTSIGQTNQKRIFSRYNLETLADWGAGSDHEFGALPSEVEYMKQAFDNGNSYNLHEIDNYFTIDPNYYYEVNREKTNTVYDLYLTTSRHHFHFDYLRGNYSGITSKNYLLFSPKINIKHIWHGGNRSMVFDYKMDQMYPALVCLIEIDNTADPLYTYSGNSHLKKYTTHTTFVNYINSNSEKQTNFNIRALYSITANALAYPYTIDKTTGKRHYYYDNVNGNYYANVSTGYSCPLDKKRKLMLSTNTLVQLTHGVDYISDDPDVAPQRNTADTWWGTENLKLNYNIGKHSIGLKGYVGVGHATSSRADFDSYTLYDFNYGLTGLLKLPYGIELSTDLTMYSRRGYATGSANTNDLVWNARLSKTFLKAGITLAVDGFDILNQLSNVTQTINSQGRTETYYNALPRYIMAHMIYRFNKKPKK